MSVDLPAPFSPTSPWTSPPSTSRSTTASACVGPKCLRTPFMLRRAFTARTPPSGEEVLAMALFAPLREPLLLLPNHADVDLASLLQLRHEQLLRLVLVDVLGRQHILAGREVLTAAGDVVALQVPHQR